MQTAKIYIVDQPAHQQESNKSLLFSLWVTKGSGFLNADNKDAKMPRLILVTAVYIHVGQRPDMVYLPPGGIL